MLCESSVGGRPRRCIRRAARVGMCNPRTDLLRRSRLSAWPFGRQAESEDGNERLHLLHA